MTTNYDEAKRIAADIKEAIISTDDQILDGYVWGVHDYEHLRVLVMESDVESLAAAQRVLLPLQKEFTPGIIGATVKNIRRQGVENAGDLVTRESMTLWMHVVDEINAYGVSMGDDDLVVNDLAQELFLLAFTEPGLALDAVALVKERGLLPVETIRALIAEREASTVPLREGSL